jgi:hypothetical protein
VVVQVGRLADERLDPVALGLEVPEPLLAARVVQTDEHARGRSHREVVDGDERRAERTPWDPDPDGRRRRQSGLDRFG